MFDSWFHHLNVIGVSVRWARLLGAWVIAICNLSYQAHGQHADFTVDVTSGCFPLTVKFTDTSTGSINSWSWDFGNGNTSSLQNPGAIYAAPGTYTVRLTVSNGTQTDTRVQDALIAVHGFPETEFSYDKDNGCAPLTVHFTDQTPGNTGTITQWQWVFGDGGTSSDANPTYTYTSAGSKTVSLKVRNEYGCEFTKTISSAITVHGPNASFTPSSVSVCQVPATINFTNSSTGASSYTWDFGDGGSSTVPNPSHTFTQAGIYSVSLSAKDANECTGFFDTVVRIGNEGGLDFQPSINKACVGQSIFFTVNSNTPIQSRLWDFGNGTQSNAENPTINYNAPGVYQITLTATLSGSTCHSIVSRTVEVPNVEEPVFTYDTDCDYNLILTKTSPSVRQDWYIQGVLVSTEESFTYTNSSPGSRLVSLFVYNDLDCFKTLQRTIIIPSRPQALFSPNLEQDCKLPSLSGCAPFQVQFTNESVSSSPYTSEWDFGDGSTSTLRNPLHTYLGKGTFTLKLTITDGKGCTGVKMATVNVSDVTPTAQFTFDKSNVCAKEIIQFKDQSQNATFWCWDFGDGITSIGKDVSHSYLMPGVYTVRLKVKNAGCSDSFEVVNAITVRNPYVNFEITKNCADPYTVGLTNLSTNFNALHWDFGDGDESDVDVSAHTYQSVGNYTIKLTGANSMEGCIVATNIGVVIQEIKADFEVDNVNPCKGAPVEFTDKSKFATQWDWTFGNGGSSTVQNPSTSYNTPGMFTATLRAYDSDGCPDQKEVSLKVLNMEGNFDFDGVSTCDELSVQFRDLSSGSPALEAWSWDFGDGETSTETNPQHQYTQLGNYPVTLRLTNSEGTCTFLKHDAVRFTNPILDFQALRNAACIGSRIGIINNTSNANQYAWTFGNGQASSDTNPVISYANTGSYDISLIARDKYGCEKSISKSAFITITKPAAQFEAFQTFSECPPLTTIFHDLSTGDVAQWQWDFGNGSFSSLQNPANLYVDPGNFTVNLIATDVNGCTDTFSAENLVHVGGPSGSFSKINTGASCVNASVSFLADSQNTTIHRWDFGDGVVEDKEEVEAQHNYIRTGLFKTKLVLIDDNGCQRVADGDVNVVVRDTTSIQLTYTPLCIFENDVFTLNARSADNVEIDWNWRIGESDFGHEPDSQVSLEKPGEHRVILEGTNSFGCTSTVYKLITVRGNIDSIPNVITPNGDDLNDHFKIEGIETNEWGLHVYNRWGNPVFQQGVYNNDWDGKNLEPGVYYFILTNNYCNYKTYKGDITIIR